MKFTALALTITAIFAIANARESCRGIQRTIMEGDCRYLSNSECCKHYGCDLRKLHNDLVIFASIVSDLFETEPTGNPPGQPQDACGFI